MADYYMCPGCGKDVKVGSAGCAECDNLDPWEIEETEIYDGVDLGDDESQPDKYRTTEIPIFWVGVAFFLFLVILLLAIGAM